MRLFDRSIERARARETEYFHSLNSAYRQVHKAALVERCSQFTHLRFAIQDCLLSEECPSPTLWHASMLGLGVRSCLQGGCDGHNSGLAPVCARLVRCFVFVLVLHGIATFTRYS